MADEVAHRGPAGITVARVIARAGVSRRAFYEIFDDVEHCLLEAFNWAIGLAQARAEVAFARERSWREEVRAGLAALLRFFDENPLLAQLCVVQAAAGGPRVLERRAEVLLELGDVVDRARERRTLAREPSPVVAEGVVGAVVTVLYGRLLGRGGPAGGYSPPEPGDTKLIDLHGELMSLIVLPYLGANAAARELERPPPAPPIDADLPALPSSGRAMLELPQGRLTYRTVRVLRAVAERPGGSNRDIAERAEIVDQGQISKILARLQEQDLLVNRGGSPHTRGTPNAWWLTERGQSLEHALRDTTGATASAKVPATGRSRRAQPGNGSGSRRAGR